MPAEHQVRGLGPIVMSVPELSRTAVVLTGSWTCAPCATMPPTARNPCVRDGRGGGKGPPPNCTCSQTDAPAARQGAGGVHHVAFRTPDEAQYHEWAERLNELRVPNSGAVDRFYFRSLYFREPNGILFEIATDGPGFAPTSRWKRWAKTWPCRRSWSRDGRRSRRG